LRRYEGAVDDIWQDFQGHPTEVIDAGDKVVTAITVHGKGKGSGVDVEMHLFNIWTLRDSKVVRLVGGYRDRSEALRDAGLPEQGRSSSP
jgi:ketosteroid isomerase-like protein